MAHTPAVPDSLRSAPFHLSAAKQAGVTRGKLRSAAFSRMGCGVYRWIGLKETPQLILTAIALRLPPGAAFSGLTAAWLHGLDVEPCSAVEVTIPEPLGSGRRAGVSVRRAALAPDEIVIRRGLPATSALRTVVDLGGREPLTEGVVAADLFLHAGLVTVGELQRYIARNAGTKGIARLRRVVSLAEPKAESAMETRLRMLLVLSRLRRPEVQVPVHDARGRFVARPDLLYRRECLAIEYDGGNHRDRMVDDDRRQNAMVAAGLRLLRFTASDVYSNPGATVTLVRRELAVSPPATNQKLTIRAQMAASPLQHPAIRAQMAGPQQRPG